MPLAIPEGCKLSTAGLVTAVIGAEHLKDCNPPVIPFLPDDPSVARPAGADRATGG
jgi:hypothetical protein